MSVKLDEPILEEHEYFGRIYKHKKVREDRQKHDCLKEGLNHCNYFSFLIPRELEDKCEIPEYAGLYVYYEGRTSSGKGTGNIIIREVKSAKLLHKRKIDDRLKYEIGRKMTYRYWDMSKKLIGSKI